MQRGRGALRVFWTGEGGSRVQKGYLWEVV